MQAFANCISMRFPERSNLENRRVVIKTLSSLVNELNREILVYDKQIDRIHLPYYAIVHTVRDKKKNAVKM